MGDKNLINGMYIVMNFYHIQVTLYYMYTVLKQKYNDLKTWINYNSLRYLEISICNDSRGGTYHAVYKFRPVVTRYCKGIDKAYLELSGRDVTDLLKLRGAEWYFFDQKPKYQELFPWDSNDILIVSFDGTGNASQHMYMWDDIISLQ